MKEKHLRYSKLSKKEASAIENSIQQLIEQIRNKRLELEISQEQLAEMLNLSTGTIKGIEQGIRTPSLVTFIRLLKVLDITISFDK